MKLSNLVADWDGFEDLVADIHRDGNVKVEKDVKLRGKSGAPRQIDVLVTSQQGFYTHRTMCECKFWNHKIKRSHVDVVFAYMSDLGIQSAAIFTTEGYQSGAKTFAKAQGISIFHVREMRDDEYGKPGRFIELYLQIWQRGINPKVRLSVGAAGPGGVSVPSIALGDRTTETKLINKGKTLEQIMLDVTYDTLVAIRNDALGQRFDSAGRCHVYHKRPFRIQFEEPALTESGMLVFLIDGDIGVRVSQSLIRFDRKSPKGYAIIVEDCITRDRHLVARKEGEETPSRRLLADCDGAATGVDHSEGDPPQDPYVNGSIVSVLHKDLVVDAHFDRLWESGESEFLVDQSEPESLADP